MFAEDIGLLPNKLFQKAMERSETQPDKAEGYLRALFAAMRSGGEFGLDDIPWFNGGLFDDDAAFPMDRADVADVLAAARLYWGDIDPAILGTLFERGLNPDKRSQLGAHYTDRDKIMLIVEPVVIRPLLAEWETVKTGVATELASAAEARETAARTPSAAKAGALTRKANEAQKKAEALRRGYLDRLKAFRVLDPACGSGNFLYLALLALKDIEHRANLEAEALGLLRGFPEVGPECVLGIELNPFAAELARVSVWIGDIQWMRRNGFDASRNPILRPLETIECRDAVLAPDGTRAEWPDADAVVGNPPFLGDKMMIGGLGENYVTRLRASYAGAVRGGADLVLYWFAQAGENLRCGRTQRVGLVATNSIRGGANRATLAAAIEGGRIFEAWSDLPWVVDGAAVRVSLVCFDGQSGGVNTVDGKNVTKVYSDLSANSTDFSVLDFTSANRLYKKSSIAFIGDQKNGDFDLPGNEARAMVELPTNVNGRRNSEVLFPWRNGADLTKRASDRWIIDFGVSAILDYSAEFEAPFEVVHNKLRAFRSVNRRPLYRDNWWLHAEPRPGMRRALKKIDRYIATPRVSKHRLFVWLASIILPDCQIVVIARDDDITFGVLHSRFHELWSLRMGTSLEDRPRYTPSTTFETFPFPEGLTPDIPAANYADDPRAQKIAAAAARLNDLRENWLNPPDLVRREPEVVQDYPDRILPVDDAAAAILKKRTLTNLYNARPAWLDNAHKALDEAVADAYGWGDDWRAGLLTDDEILARLFHLNQQRAAAQTTAG
jgi:type II restriction/modification system DNA methylase subunit YeeA